MTTKNPRPWAKLSDRELSTKLTIAASDGNLPNRASLMQEAALRLSEPKVIYNPARVVIGHCPQCGGVVVIHNNHEMWPVATCPCGWNDGTTALDNKLRRDADWIVSVVGGERVRCRPTVKVNVNTEIL